MEINPSKTAIATLKKLGIKTTADLDTYRYARPKDGRWVDSRYGTLKTLVGERDADRIIRRLEVASW
jgi:hypothetical protein